MHPRTVYLCEKNNLAIASFENIEILSPQSYLDMMNLLKNCEALITDSGGMQKEAYMFHKKCITVRSETEWVETLQNGWNTLVFDDLTQISQVLNTPLGEYTHQLYGDGKAALKISEVVLAH